jgi:uncharacterized damage-inducible protein DinB
MSVIPMERPSADEHIPYFGKYINVVPSGNIVSLMTEQLEVTLHALRTVSETRAAYRYAPEKWSVKQVVGHLIDTERVFTYRAMCFARGESTDLPSFDENEFMQNASFDNRTLGSLIDEFEIVRHATISLFANLTSEEWLRSGRANKNLMSVRAAAWIIVGHEMHHRQILQEKYLQ